MFYRIELEDHIRVPPNMYNLPVEEAVIKRIKSQYNGFISQELGIVIDVSKIKSIGEGILIPGDGAVYYIVIFELLSFKPELQEVVLGKIKDIAEFGAFINIGPIEGMIHVSQTMDDYVSFSKDKTLAGKESKHVLKVNDLCKAKIIAISFKDPNNPKLGLTMRQPGLGRLDWIEEDKQPTPQSQKIKKSSSLKNEKKSM